MKRIISKLLVISFITQTVALPAYAEETSGTTTGLFGITNINSGTNGTFGATGTTSTFGTISGFGTNGSFGQTSTGSGLWNGGDFNSNASDFSFTTTHYNPLGLDLGNTAIGSSLSFNGFNSISNLGEGNTESSGALSYNTNPSFASRMRAYNPDFNIENNTPREIFMKRVSEVDNTEYITPINEFDMQLSLYDTQSNPFLDQNKFKIELGSDIDFQAWNEEIKRTKRNNCRDLYVDIMVLDKAEERAVTCSGKSVYATVYDIEDTLRQINYYENLLIKLNESSTDGVVNLQEYSEIIIDLKQARINSGYKDPEADDELNQLGREKNYLEAIGLGETSDNEVFENLEVLSSNNFKAIEAKIAILKTKVASLEQNINDYADSPVHKDYEALKAFLVRNFERRGCLEEFKKVNSPVTDDWKIRDLENSVCHQKSIQNIYGTELPELVTDVNNILKKLDYAAAEEFDENITQASENDENGDIAGSSSIDEQEFSEFYDACKSAVTLSPYIIYSCEKMFRTEWGGRKDEIGESLENAKFSPMQCGENEIALYDTKVNGEKQFASASAHQQQRREREKLFEAFDANTQNLSSKELELIALSDNHEEKLIASGRIDNSGGTDDLGGNGNEEELADNGDDSPQNKNGGTGNNGTSGDNGSRGNENKEIVDPGRFIASFDNVRGVESENSCASSERYVRIGDRHACVLKCNQFQTPTGAENGYKCETNHVSVNSYNSAYDERKKSQDRGDTWTGGVAAVGGAVAMVGIVSWASGKGRNKGRETMTDMLNNGVYTAQSPTIFSAPRGTFGSYSPFTRFGGQSYSSSLNDGLFNFNNTGFMFDPSNPLMNGSYGGAIGGSYSGYGGIGIPSYTSYFNGYATP